ncbi:MAG: phosphoglucosamine mutase [Bacteroidota bacterium]|nr:phosphoglucosamine mutase [Bacteroidota bacterium]
MHTLIESVSGIRGIFGAGLDAGVLVRYALAFGTWCRRRTGEANCTVVVGRDARVSGEICAQIVTATLRSVGINVVDAGLACTPTVAMGVLMERAQGGIILSASHNPEQWNALKLLNSRSEFLAPDEVLELQRLARNMEPPSHADIPIGSLRVRNFTDPHIEAICRLDFVDIKAIAERDFSVAVDGINSVGAIALPRLLKRLGVRSVHVINGDVSGRFAHPAEPLPEHLEGTMAFVRQVEADLGLVVDPDADRLALIDDNGCYVSEELTQVIAADFLWQRRTGPFVTNLSSSRAIDDLAARYGEKVHRSAVGEINVVKAMQAHEAVLGGEGNGGVILPDLHYGRDALVGAAIVLQQLADRGEPLSQYRQSLPAYVISKNKLTVDTPDEVLSAFADRHAARDISTVDGVKVNFDVGWVHIRKSNTEPIIRIYAEARTRASADDLARWAIVDIRQENP